MIKSWLFEFFRAPTEEGWLVQKPKADTPPEETATQFAAYWDMWTRAEGFGFEGIFFSEHHFGPGYSPSPNLLIAALAASTKTLRLGVLGNVLPYYHPWRVLEEFGMLDQLTGGRLELGTASGIPPEMANVGIGAVEAKDRYLEAQDVIDWALANRGKPITHHGKYWNCDNLVLVPPMLQARPNNWTAVVSEDSARRSARRASKICTGFSSVDQVKHVFNAYRQEAAAAGHEVDDDWFGVRRIVIVDRDGPKARDLAERVQDQVRNVFLKADDRVNHGPIPDAPQKSHGGMQLSKDEFIAGTPAEVADQIIAQCQAVGAAHFMGMLDNHGALAENLAAYDLFGRAVIPILRKTQDVIAAE